MNPKEIAITAFDYPLAQEDIAQYPLAERDHSKLLVYKEHKVSHHFYHQLPELIPSDYTLVFNESKVVHARLLFEKASGGKIELFCLEPDATRYSQVPIAMQEKACVYWNVLVGGANKWKNEDPIFLKTAELSITAKKITRFDTHFLIQFSWDQLDWSFAEVLQHAGNIPLPPYMQRTAAIDDATRYQTVYAKAEGSVAAPTAGLHFTERLFNQLHQKNIHTSFLQLHVGAGTFMPVKSATLSEHPMHAEWIVIDKVQIKNIQEGLANGLIAVGTTSLRSLESMYWIGYKLHFNIPVDWKGVAVEQWFAYEQEKDLDSSTALQAILTYLEENQLDFVHTKTQILIARPYKAKMIKALITNFHQPQSTLLVLVDALIGEVWKELYDIALKNKYRFLSYGDGCLFWL